MDYLSLLAEADQEAREDYAIDPRLVQYLPEKTDPVTNSNATIQDEISNEIQVQPESIIDSLAVPVQNQPTMVEQKHIVIIDTAHRDWTVQPNAYSNTFSFGLQNPTPTVTGQIQIPFYFNNITVPFSAYEMPTIPRSTGQHANNNGRLIPGTGVNPSGAGDLGQIYGWRLVTEIATGRLVHSDTVSEATLAANPNLYTIVYFPVYDNTETRGARIGIDRGTENPATNVYPFATQLHLSNVQSLRLVHATLPVRAFDSYNASIFTDTTGTVTNAKTNILNGFYTEPYVAMTIENMKGAYYGANQVIQNSFALLVQQSRNQYDAQAKDIIAQFMDFYPWSAEEYTFEPPLAKLSNVPIALSNTLGKPFIQNDDIQITSIVFNNCTANNFGIMTINTSRPFGTDEVQVGDMVTVYSPVITQLTSDPSCTPIISTFLNTLNNNNMFVQQTNISAYPGVPLIDVGYSYNALLKTQGYSNVISVYSNLSQLVFAGGLQSNASGNPYIAFQTGGIYSNTFSMPNPLPMMNLNMQVTYALEVVTLTPDTTKLKKIIPN
jgi:hypothetical protein